MGMTCHTIVAVGTFWLFVKRMKDVLLYVPKVTDNYVNVYSYHIMNYFILHFCLA